MIAGRDEAPRPAAHEAPVLQRFRWSLVYTGGGVATSTVVLLAVSRCVDPREYGRVAVVQATWALLFTAISWCGDLLVRFGPEELRARGRLHTALSTRLCFAAAALALLLPTAPLYLVVWRGWSAALALLTVGFLLCSTVYDALEWSGVAAQRFGPLAVARVGARGAPLVAVALAAALHRVVRAELLLAAVVAGAAFAACVLAGALGGVVGLARPDRALFGRMWRYKRPALIGLPATAAIAAADPLVLSAYAARADVGRLQLALPTFTIFAALGESFNAVFSPELVRARAGDARALSRYLGRVQPRAAVVLGCVGFGLAAFAAPLGRLLLPEAYALSADLVALLCVAGGFMLALWTLLPAVTAADRVGCLQASFVAQSLASVGGDCVLAPRLGAVGVALASIAARAVALALLALLLRRRIGARLAALGPLLGAGALVTATLTWSRAAPLRPVLGVALLGAAACGAWRLWRAR